MSDRVQYTPYHPKWYRRNVSVWWWLEHWVFARFVLREITSVAVGFFAFLYLWQLRALVKGPDAYAQFLDLLKSPLYVILNSIAFLLILYHAITWFNLAPKAMAVRLLGKRVPDAVIISMNYAAWLVVTVAVVWFMLE